MEWKLTKEGGRPLHEDQMKWDKEKQESVLVVPHKKEVYCLCKYEDNLTPFVLIYNLDIDGWIDPDSEYPGKMEFDKVEKWCLLSDIDDVLDGKPESCWCWSYGETLAKTSVKALDKWIKECYSHPCGVDEDAWKTILETIKHAFEVSIEDFDNDIAITPEMSEDEKQRIIKEHKAVLEAHKQLRKEAFALLAEYYLDLWD